MWHGCTEFCTSLSTVYIHNRRGPFITSQFWLYALTVCLLPLLHRFMWAESNKIRRKMSMLAPTTPTNRNNAATTHDFRLVSVHAKRRCTSTTNIHVQMNLPIFFRLFYCTPIKSINNIRIFSRDLNQNITRQAMLVYYNFCLLYMVYCSWVLCINCTAEG